MAQDTDLRELLDRSAQYYARQNISTAIPAVIISMPRFSSQQVVSVRPLINRVFEDGTDITCADVYDVPVAFPTGGGGIMTFPLVVGDTVLLVYSMRSLDEWMDSDGSTQTPIDNRHFHRTDAIAIPGIYTRSTSLAPSPTDVEIKFKNMNIIMQPDDTLTLKSNASSITLAPSGDINIAASGDVNITGTNVNLN